MVFTFYNIYIFHCYTVHMTSYIILPGSLYLLKHECNVRCFIIIKDYRRVEKELHAFSSSALDGG